MSKPIPTTLYISIDQKPVVPVTCKSMRVARATAQNLLAMQRKAHPSGHWMAFTTDGFMTISLKAPYVQREGIDYP